MIICLLSDKDIPSTMPVKTISPKPSKHTRRNAAKREAKRKAKEKARAEIEIEVEAKRKAEEEENKLIKYVEENNIPVKWPLSEVERLKGLLDTDHDRDAVENGLRERWIVLNHYGYYDDM